MTFCCNSVPWGWHIDVETCGSSTEKEACFMICVFLFYVIHFINKILNLRKCTVWITYYSNDHLVFRMWGIMQLKFFLKNPKNLSITHKQKCNKFKIYLHLKFITSRNLSWKIYIHLFCLLFVCCYSCTKKKLRHTAGPFLNFTHTTKFFWTFFLLSVY